VPPPPVSFFRGGTPVQSPQAGLRKDKAVEVLKLHAEGRSDQLIARNVGWLAPRTDREQTRRHGARGALNFGITLSANRRRLSREPWLNSRT